MASAPYKLSCALYGHTLDVRSIAINQEGCIVSGSRDRTAKVWKPNGINTGYTEIQSLEGHTNFVSCVCVLPPDAQHPSGLIVTGSNDSTIRVFVLELSQPISVLQGHKNVVCNLSPGIKGDTVVSSSWDSTAGLWHIGSSTRTRTFSGHQMAVWSAIELASGYVVTGSADKSIKIWRNDGFCEKTLTGHTDCVRGLAATSVTEFLSVANDASVRHWNATQGTCLATFYGHANYIYCVSVFPQGGVECFVTSGEDHTVRVWQGGEVEQTIVLPAQSVWSVACLSNGDIVTGSSDGVIRIFTCDTSRQADPILLKQYDEQVCNMNLNAEQEFGGMKLSEIPGKETLLQPGKTDGQTKIIRDGTSVFCYSWNAADNEWVKVGDVLGASGGTQKESGKTLYNGKEYDYVFSVDIEDGMPPLKLPYNTDEDPWFAAQKFIHDNNLSQHFLEEVANFIIKNSKKESTVTEPSYCDPFTGGSRYIPSRGNASEDSAVTDPFTGGNRYVPSTSGHSEVGTSGHKSAQVEMCPSKPYFPLTNYVRFDQANLRMILEKLLELNKKSGDGSHKIEESNLEGVVKLSYIGSTGNTQFLEVLKQLLEWPKDILFPVLDVTRLAVRNEEVNRELCSGQMGDQLFSYLRNLLLPEASHTNQMLTLRIFSNMLSHPPGEQLVLKNQDYMMSALLDIVPPFNKQMQVAVVTLLLNITVAINRTKNSEARLKAVNVATGLLPRLSDAEAQFRGLVALGTLLWEADSESQEQMMGSISSSKEVMDILKSLVATVVDPNDPDPAVLKTSQCAAQVIALIRK